jgi:hypothetical protein
LPTYDFSHEEREEMQCLTAELDTMPGKRAVRAAELILLRKFYDYVRDYGHLFPDRLQAARRALRRERSLELLSADQRAELEKAT